MIRIDTQTEGQKFSMMIDTPVTIFFVILQNQNQKFKQKLFEHNQPAVTTSMLPGQHCARTVDRLTVRIC